MRLMPKIKKQVETEDFVEQRKTARLDIPIKVQYKLRTIDNRPLTIDQKKVAETKNISMGGCLGNHCPSAQRGKGFF